MTNYYVLNDNKIVLFDTDKQRLTTTLKLIPQYNNLEIFETERPIVDFQFTDTEDYEQQQAEKERERINNLTLTKRVFALALKQFGISYNQLKELISTNDDALLEWELCSELVRSNPLLDIMAAEIGITPELLDYIFRKCNGEEVEPPEVEEEDEEVNKRSTPHP